VVPSHRGRGIARALLRRQHDWCRERGFLRVETQTTNAFKPMLILNLSEGFDVTGTAVDDYGELKIHLRKSLVSVREE
jgi:GNAT superfamily N-acetyltransferase